jgi:hypothetical protein
MFLAQAPENTDQQARQYLPQMCGEMVRIIQSEPSLAKMACDTSMAPPKPTNRMFLII